MDEAADEIELLREAIRRLADQDATLSVQGGNVIVDIECQDLLQKNLTDEGVANHDAVPEAIAYGQGRDNPDTPDRFGTGNTQRPAAWATFYPNGSTEGVYAGIRPPNAEPLYRACQDLSQKNLTPTTKPRENDHIADSGKMVPTLLDTFAAAALTGLMADDGDRTEHAMPNFTARAYELADAMLSERGNHSEKANSSPTLTDEEMRALALAWKTISSCARYGLKEGVSENECEPLRSAAYTIRKLLERL
jgi:hypothetical protein